MKIFVCFVFAIIGACSANSSAGVEAGINPKGSKGSVSNNNGEAGTNGNTGEHPVIGNVNAGYGLHPNKNGASHGTNNGIGVGNSNNAGNGPNNNGPYDGIGLGPNSKGGVDVGKTLHDVVRAAVPVAAGLPSGIGGTCGKGGNGNGGNVGTNPGASGGKPICDKPGANSGSLAGEPV